MPGLPPVAELSFNRFGGTTMPVETSYNVSETVITRILNNPNRLSITITNQGDYDIRVATVAAVTIYNGWLLAAKGGVLSWDWFEDGESVTYELFMLSIVGASKALVREVLRS